MSEMNKQAEYGGYTFNIKIELDVLQERHPGGKHQHKVTVNDMGQSSNYYETYTINESSMKHDLEHIFRKTEAWVDGKNPVNPRTEILESLGFQNEFIPAVTKLRPEIWSSEDFINVEDEMPNQKDLVVCFDGELYVPAIYYKSLKGFYHFSTYYHTNRDTTYSKARTEDQYKIHNVTKWMIMPGTDDGYNTRK